MQTKYLLALNAHPKIGSQTLKKILAVFEDKPESIWNCNQSTIEARLGSKIANLIIEVKNDFDPEKEVEKLKSLDIGYITMYDKSYPQLLLETPDCPALLYIKGDPTCLSAPSLGVVGSRKYSNYGKTNAQKFSRESIQGGLNIISGLALGIDAIAHREALDSNGITVGVLGCGLDQIYPTSNAILANEMINKGGAVISEFPPNTPPYKQNFPLRNRIIAGLSLGVLVIEAAEKSGALITAYTALDYNREVFAIPGNIDSEASKGTNQLIQKGAKLVTEIDDIFDELNVKTKKQEIRAKEILPESEEEKLLMEILKEEKNIDQIIVQSKLNIIALNSTLSLMEMKGIIENIGGGRYKLK